MKDYSLIYIPKWKIEGFEGYKFTTDKGYSITEPIDLVKKELKNTLLVIPLMVSFTR